jgi:hypothetical protein
MVGSLSGNHIDKMDPTTSANPKTIPIRRIDIVCPLTYFKKCVTLPENNPTTNWKSFLCRMTSVKRRSGTTVLRPLEN